MKMFANQRTEEVDVRKASSKMLFSWLTFSRYLLRCNKMTVGKFNFEEIKSKYKLMLVVSFKCSVINSSKCSNYYSKVSLNCNIMV